MPPKGKKKFILIQVPWEREIHPRKLMNVPFLKGLFQWEIHEILGEERIRFW